MRIESIRLKNFKGFRDAEMRDIPPFCVVIGANGTGKTTLFDVFGFLRDCLTFNVSRALQARGGFAQVLSRGAEINECIELEIKFRLDIAGVKRLVTYAIQIGLERHKPVVRHEILRYKRGEHGSPYHFLNFHNGEGYAITNEEDFDKEDKELSREYQAVGTDVLAIKGLGQFARFKAASAFRQLVENWHVSDFHINLARGSKDAIGEDEHLSVSGENLQLVARHIYEHDPALFRKIVEAMQQRVPGIGNVEPQLTQDGRLILSFQDASFTDPFIDRYVSDGTIKMFAYLLLLYDPKPHPLLCVEEPENQLYPNLLWELAEEFRAYSERGGQVFVSSHSPDFLNATRLDEVFWLIKEKGYTTIHRARDNKQIAEFMKAGDQMGYLWKEGLFQGVNP
ncbi:AAA family ATPase [Cardiobacterium valvarum]|uniref:RecF/RecN/SMC protein n=1 Tax=Cardiobacterium valvarum F0432 TaxID=797473 RepID=G9ZCG8_9GAMM|nr:AAA family ATPase [Cardiobacterium valvarum]EHM55783.1 RecF/RecN/SMC protein [Cardiobacterium valvarum F0432]